jgi:hypothetical protein
MGLSEANVPINFTTLAYTSTKMSPKDVGTLALGLQPMQGFARLRAKKEAQESHLVLPSELPFWELESQMDSQIFRGQLQGSKPTNFLYH